MADDESADASSAELQPFAYQVGGHKKMQVIGEGALIVKPTLPLELQFYQGIQSNPALSSLRPWVPTYLGTLRLEGQNTAEGIASVEGIPETEKEMIVLENVTGGFRKPNILDVKLGTVLYDEETPPEKRKRAEKKARYTTTGDVGIRLTGFQVFGNKARQPLVFPKSYGMSISTAELSAGITRFFPVHGSMAGLPGSESGGQLDVGLPDTLLVPILRSIRKSVQELRDILSSIELRMISSSLLIVYEGDWDRAEMGVEWLAKQSASISSEEDGEEINEDTEVEEWEEDEESEEDGSDEEMPESPCVVRLIDFAHTRLKPGEGPDVGLLKGLDTLLGLLDGRIASVA